MRTARFIAALLPVALMSVACGGGTDVKPSDGKSANVAEQSPSGGTGTSADPSLPSEDTLETYFNGVASNALEDYQAALDTSQPGSPAHAYATYLHASKQSEIDGGTSEDTEAPTVDKTDKGFKFCEGSGADETCYEFTQIEGEGGKVADFLVNGKSFDNRLSVGNGKPVAGTKYGASATFIAAYETAASNRLLICISVKTGRTALGTLNAKYRSAEGRQAEATRGAGPDDLDANSLANYTFEFPNAKVGGTFTLSYYDAGFNDEGTITIKTR